MTTPAQPATPEPAAPAQAAHEGPVAKAEHAFAGFFHRDAIPAAEHVVSGVQAALERAASTLPVAVKVLNAAKLVDPADGELLDAFGELLPEALGVALKDVSEALAALKAA